MAEHSVSKQTPEHTFVDKNIAVVAPKRAFDGLEQQADFLAAIEHHRAAAS